MYYLYNKARRLGGASAQPNKYYYVLLSFFNINVGLYLFHPSKKNEKNNTEIFNHHHMYGNIVY